LFSNLTIRSRRARKLSRIFFASSCGPFMASTAAHCVICEAQESVLVTQRVNTGASALFAVKPRRQPVIAQVFEAPSEMMVRSSISGNWASDTNSPS
jgi:hypothetical protein